MIYFLNTSKEVQRREEWAAILPTYFTALKESYVVELSGRADALAECSWGDHVDEWFANNLQAASDSVEGHPQERADHAELQANLPRVTRACNNL